MAAEWPEVSLGDVAELLTGFPFKSALYTEDPDAPRLLRGDNVVQGAIRWDGAKRWPLNRVAGQEAYWLKPGDVVVAMDRPWIEAGLKYATVRESDTPCLLVQRVARLRGTAALDCGYLSYVVAGQSFTSYVLSIQTGTAVPHISGGQILAFRFCLPSIAEQRAIAHILGSLDDKIDLNRRMNDTLEALARGMFDDMFGEEAADAVVGDLADIERDSVTPMEHEDELFDHYSLPAFDEGRRPVREHGGSIKSNKFVVRPGAVLLSKLNPAIPRVWYPRVRRELRSIASTEFQVMRPRETCSPEFLYCLLRSKVVREHLVGLASGTSNSHQRVKPDDLLATPAPRPSASSLARFTRVAGPMLEWVNASIDESQTLAALRDALLPKLLSGELRIEDVEGFVPDGA